MITYKKAAKEDIRPAFDLIEKVWNVSGFGKFDVLQESVTQNTEKFERYASGKHIMFIAQADKNIVGVIGADDKGFVHELFIDGAFERRGIATELLSRAVCELKLRGIDVIRLGSSQLAITFYEKFGFIKTGEEQLINGFMTTPMEYTPNEIWDVLDENGKKPDGCTNAENRWLQMITIS
jgi:ribosomal protein S18 acetylase RimI-like enzyme